MKSFPVNMRFDEHTVKRLDKIAAESTLERSVVVRAAVTAVIKKFEKDGKITFPLELK